jgi:hypothetical protein
VSEEKNLPQPDPDPLELWRRWYEAGIGSWPGLSQDGNGSYDPYGLYQQWLSGLKDLGQQMGTTSNDEEDRYEYWQRLMDATAESWRRALGLTPVMVGVAPRWAEMVGEFWQQMLGQDGPPVDPLDFYQRCYKALNGPLSEIATETLENDSFLEYSRQAFRYYATLDRMFGHLAEEYFGRLHLSTSSESTRIAGLVVAVDERIDRLEDALEGADYGREGVATGSDVEELKNRLGRVESRLGQLDRVEEKLDRLLGGAESSSNGGGREIKATDAARRKAQELGVDLAAVEGTGADGQITVGDVREKGEG